MAGPPVPPPGFVHTPRRRRRRRWESGGRLVNDMLVDQLRNLALLREWLGVAQPGGR